MSSSLRSFYGHVVLDRESHLSVFIREKEGYYLAFIYPMDQKQFEAEYEKEGVFFRNLQMPRVFSYAKRKVRLDSEKSGLVEKENEDETETPNLPKGPLKELKKKPKKKKYPWFTLSFTKALTDGRVIETWQTKTGKTVEVFKDANGGFSNTSGNER